VSGEEEHVSGEVKVRVSLRDGSIELEGPQEFVEKQMETFGDLIKASLEGYQQRVVDKRKPAAGEAAEDDQQQDDDPAGAAMAGQYTNVHAVNDDEVQLLVEALPGSSDKERTVNAALLMLLGYEGIGKTDLPSEVIADVCRHYSCYSEGNFGRYLGQEKRLFLIGGTRRKQTVKLTAPGKLKAKELAERLNREEASKPETPDSGTQ